MSWKNQLKGDSLSWLLENDSPGVHYLALRDLVEAAEEVEISAARKAAHKDGPIADILQWMSEDGYWEKEGPGYNPKYRSTVWALIMLVAVLLQLTLLLWLATILLGFAIYVVWYVAPAPATTPDPAATPELIAPVETPELVNPAETPELVEPAETPEPAEPAETPEASG